MKDMLFLAFAYLRHHAARSAILIFALALIAFVPLATRLVLQAAESQLTARAAATPLMIGARGSALDLMMNGLYFTADRPERITIAAADRVWDSDLAIAIPLHVRFTARQAPVVGTTLDYFDFRKLEIAEGRPLALLGEAVLGARAAARLGLAPGETLITDPENLFDIAGTYPLELQIAGVLAPTGSADDDAVFVDLPTAWVIEGLGHGHEDVVQAGSEGAVVANAAIRQFTRITPENVDSFHFHGAPESFPISSVIALPHDARHAAVLRGRYLHPAEETRVVLPEQVVSGLLTTIFRVGQVLDAVFVIVGIAAAIAIALAFYLSLKLRSSEMETAFRLGAYPSMIARLLGTEALLIILAAILLAAFALFATSPFIDDIAIWLVTNRT